jgi:hypothetical protein
MASAGYIQLAAIGQQDAYLTGTPSVTYFQGVYSRNTPFVLEAYDIPFIGSQQAFGTQSICKIPFKGDIVRGMTLKLNMPYLNNPGNDWNWSNIASEAGFYPKITVDGKYIRGPTAGITYYSTNLQSQFQLSLGWMNNPAQVPYIVSSTVAPVTGTSITIPFNTGNVLPNYNMFAGYTATTSVVTGTMTVATYTTTSITFTIQSQTTGQINSGNTVYISGATLQSNIVYDANINKFAFISYSNVTVEPGQATFWGLDPKNFDNVLPDGNLNYIISSSSFHNNNTPLGSNKIAYGDFTLEVGGWSRGNGIPSAAKRAGLYFQTISSIIPSTNGTTPFRFVSRAGDTTQNYVFFDFSKYLNISQVSGSTFCFQSPQGCIGFTVSGQYCIRGSFITPPGVTTYSIGFGFSTNDGHPGTAQFISERVLTLSATTPTPIFTIPVNVTIPQGFATLYMYIDFRVFPVNGQLQAGSWISIGPVDSMYTVSPSAGISTGTQISLSNFSGYTSSATPTTTIIPGAANSFTFNQTGTFLMTAVFALQNSTLTSVTISNGTRGANAYTYTTYQGQFGYASLDFMLPVYVTSTTLPYFIDISMQNLSGTVTTDTILGSNVSYIQFIQNTAVSPTSSYPQNGLMIVPKNANFSLSSPIDFSNGLVWNPYGGSTQLAISGQQIALYVGGLYYLQAVLCTSDTLKSVTVNITGSYFSSVTHNISVGLLPPYVVGIPFYIPTASQITPALTSISFVTTSGTSTTMFSNTVFSVGIFASNLVPVYTYVDSVGTYAIGSADLRIGGQVIQSLSGEQIELYNDLYVPYENQPGLRLLTGKGDTSNVFDPGRTYYTNLPFYFYGNTELSIPVCALGRSDLEVAVTLLPFSNLTYVSNISSLSQFMSMTMIVEYGFLSENETKWMTNNRLEYLITQSQAVSFTAVPGFSTGVFNLPFLNPVRELYIVIQNAGTAPYDFSNNGLLNLGLKFNGQEFLSRQVVDSQYLQYVQTFQKYNVTPTRAFYVYSFANDPMNPRPTGQVNLSRIKDVSLELTLNPLTTLSRSIRVYAMNYNILRIENGIAGLMFNFSQVH